MARGGRRSTTFKPGVSGNARGRPKKAATERPQVATNGIRICLDITLEGASALRRSGLIAAGEEANPSAIGIGLLEAAAR